MIRIRNVVLIALTVVAVDSRAETRKQIAASGEERVQLVELYSSESCSSCPPADNWISTLKDNPGLWKTFVPVVFHVDYWNDLGWKDGLSSNAMTKRQQDVAHTWTEPSVYTPAVVVDGREWREWSSQSLPAKDKTTKLQVLIYQNSAGEFDVVVRGLERQSKEDKFIVRMAKLGMGLSSNVTSGENSGRLLKHNFVILDWNSMPVSASSSKATFHFGTSFVSSEEKGAPKTAVVAWIEKIGKPVPLQAAGGYL